MQSACLERLSTNTAGKVIYELKHPFRDGTTHILFSPEDFMARLASGRSPTNALADCFAISPGAQTQGQPDPLSRSLCAQLSVQERHRAWLIQTGSQETEELNYTYTV